MDKKNTKVTSLDDVRAMEMKDTYADCSGCGRAFAESTLRFSPAAEEHIRRLARGEDVSDDEVTDEEMREVFCPECWAKRFG